MGFRSRRPTRVALLNARHRAARLVWSSNSPCYKAVFTYIADSMLYGSDPQRPVHGPVPVRGSNGAGPPKEH
ncbi:hypothetical protein TNCV_882531 [Trichonephila clavipes]|nr:hypothetical protein TNCV_882531 [Trichonephila clavipes]